VKPLKRLALIAGGIVILGVGWLAIDTYQPAPKPVEELAAMPVLTRNPQRADRIQIVRRSITLNLERRGQVWGLAQSGGYPVKPGMAQTLLDQLVALRLTFPTAPDKTELRVDNPAEVGATLTGVRVQAVDGAGLGALIVSDHDPTATMFPAHQLGDPRDWDAVGALNIPADPMAWVQTRILTLDPARVTGATLFHGTESVPLDAADAAARLRALESMVFSDVHPAVQIPAEERGRLVFALTAGGTLTVTIRMQAQQVWLELNATAPGVTMIPPGDWVFRYPAGAMSLLQLPA
jgi:hypothetical protein